MWCIFFTMTFSVMVISVMTEGTKIWGIIFWFLMMICLFAQVITENKQETRIKELEEKIEELVGEDNAKEKE